jgi:hypothetical protein
MRLFFGVFLLAGLAVIWLGTISPMIKAAAALGWKETPCVVDSSRVVTVPARKGSPTYRVEVVYHYECEGNTYTSNRYQFASGSSAGRDRKQKVVAQYPPGRQTVCFVNPSHPTEAVIHRGLNVEMLFGLFGLPFAIIGALGIGFVPRLVNAPTASQKNVVPTFTPATGEPTELKPQATPLVKFFTMLAFGIFWNGLMSVFFYFVFLSPNHHGEPLFAKIIVGLFTAIGVLIILATIGSFLALFNPRVMLNARTNAVPLGGDFQFEWSVRGHTEKLRTLRIVLEAREEAVYRSGKNVQTATHVFAEIPVMESSEREIVNQGYARVTIPPGLMHTFNGHNNRIVWRLRVRGEIPKWPDLEQEHLINVLPHRTTT